MIINCDKGSYLLEIKYNKLSLNDTFSTTFEQGLLISEFLLINFYDKLEINYIIIF